MVEVLLELIARQTTLAAEIGKAQRETGVRPDVLKQFIDARLSIGGQSKPEPGFIA